MRRAFAVVLLFTVACSRAPEPDEARKPAAPKREAPEVTMLESAKKIGDRLVLATAPVNARQQFELAIGPCERDVCPMVVSLTEQDVALAQLETGFKSASREAQQVDVRPEFGVGDPSGPPSGLTAWVTGEGENYLATTVRVLELSRGFNALLIDQVRGINEPKRRHELYGLVGERLTRLWESGEGAGPAVTSTAILRDRRAILYFDGFRYTTASRPDTLLVMLLTWDPRSQHIEYGPPSAITRAVLVPGFPSVAAARAAQQRCISKAYVLAGRAFPEAGRAGFVLVLPTTDEAVARAYEQEAEKCLGGRKTQVVTMK